MPAAALLAPAVWLLVRDAGERPLGAPRRCSASRWASRPACARSRCRWWRWRRCTFARAARLWVHARHAHVGCLRGRLPGAAPLGRAQPRRYGEFFLTDSHGGHTALVGRQPELRRALQPLAQPALHEGTGYALLRAAAPRRRSRRLRAGQAVDGLRAALRARPARRQGRSPADARAAAALLAALSRRACCRGPAQPGSRATAPASSGSSTASGTLLVAAVADRDRRGRRRAGTGRRCRSCRCRWRSPRSTRCSSPRSATTWRSRAPVPVRGRGAAWLGRRPARPRPPPRRAPPAAAPGAEAVVAAVASRCLRRLAAPGGRRRPACASATAGRSASATVAGAKRLCDVRAPRRRRPAQTPSPVRGVWDGFGLALSASRAAAAADVELPPGATGFPCAPSRSAGAARPGRRRSVGRRRPMLAQACLADGATPITLAGVVRHPGGKLHVEVGAGARNFNRHRRRVPTLWISSIKVEPDPLDA